jgi:hypothetical protein
MAGASPPWVLTVERKAANFSLLAKIAAWSVVFGIVLEDWDTFGIAWNHHFPYLIRASVGGAIVAVGIALEIRFSSLEAKSERRIRDWYALRVAELNAETESLRKENNETALLLADRTLGDAMAFADAMKEFRGTKAVICVADDRESKDLAWHLEQILRTGGSWEMAAERKIGNITTEGIRVSCSRAKWMLTLSCGSAGEALADWLNKARATANALPNNDAPEDSLMITIGPKPSSLRVMKLLERQRFEHKRELKKRK